MITMRATRQLLLGALLLSGLAASVSAATAHPTLAIGADCPDFNLPGVDGKMHALADYKAANILVVIFTCDHCATAEAYEQRIMQLTKDYSGKGVQVVAICGNDPQALRVDELCFSDVSDSLDDMKIRAADRNFNFPYLYDGDTQKITQAFGPIATPHVFIFDAQRKLRYQGRVDNSEVKTVTVSDARNALEDLLAGRKVAVQTTRVFGCSTKWSEKRQAAADWLKKAEAEPVSLSSIDEAGVAKLAKNDTHKLLVVNIWATWCGPCVAELPDYVTMNQMYRPRNFQMVTISGDEPEARDSALDLLKKDHVSSTNYIWTGTDKDKLADALDKQWQGPFPYTVIIAPGGRVVYRHEGAADPLEVRKAIVDWLGRTAAERGNKKDDEP